MNSLKYTVPARIAIDLYDMNGNLGRLDGSMGFSIENPRLVFTAKESETILINANNLDKELEESVYQSLENTKKKYELKGGIELSIIESIPSHSGFGSKTATLISTNHAYLNLYNIDEDYRYLGTFLKRGGTSGLGINLIDKGGFIVDGGHSKEIKTKFGPSSASSTIYPPPVLVHYEMPEWKILLCTPDIDKTYGKKEIDFFNKVCPINEEYVGKLARIRFSQTLPSIVENNLDLFSASINNIQEFGWKSEEINVYCDTVKQIMLDLKKHGVKGSGMSSIGPTIYAFGENLDEISKKIKAEHDLTTIITKPDNTGIIIEKKNELYDNW